MKAETQTEKEKRAPKVKAKKIKMTMKKMKKEKKETNEEKVTCEGKVKNDEEKATPNEMSQWSKVRMGRVNSDSAK